MRPQKQTNNLTVHLLCLLYSIACYLIFLAAVLYLIGFTGGVLVPKNINDGPAVDWPTAVLINGLLLILFGVQHSLMARRSFKDRMTALIAPVAERSTYVLLSSLVLGVTFWLWQPIPYTVWEVEAAWAKALLSGLFWLGWGLVLLATFLISHFELFGLKQAFDHWRNAPQKAAIFKTPLLYRVVRHPMYLGFLIALWATPHMTAGHLLFALGMSVYLFVGARFEERDLVQLFGEPYQRYQREVGMIVPQLKKRRR
ncbi:putative membrane protein [Pseudomonas synxantha BG33R]|uniref:methanethiol S-methyltransferase n=1 Tax=Pseudomonas TaxID=286 RepID=UPI00025FE747|nr:MULTISPECIES: methanethiol S-methyltransferase [Pseudomonas]EIK68650.1 putative membrane protein [Pseudomonas synxantha BG33R]QOY73845.1 isoprenylcysteine carboxylmethyltransferase family protein [Pseudomonas sp. OST1909]